MYAGSLRGGGFEMAARFTKKNYFSKDPDQLAMAAVRPEGEISRAPPKVFPQKRLWRQSWFRRTIKALGVVALGTGGLAGCFAEGTRDAIRELAVSYAADVYNRVVNAPPPVESETSSVAVAPPVAMPGTSPIDTGTVDKRTVRKKKVKEEPNPFLRFGMRFGEAVDEFFGYRRKD
jgi:hypothetical protein